VSSGSAQAVDAHVSMAAIGAAIGPAIGHHFELTFRRLSGRGVVQDRRFVRLISGAAHPLGNLAVLTPPVSAADARAALAPLSTLPVPAAAVFPGLETPADVAAVLAEHGFAAAGRIPAMGVDIARLAGTGLPAGYEFVRVGGSDSAEWVRQFARGYELPVAVAEYFAPAAFGANDAPDAAVQFFAIRHGGAIVSTSMCHLADGFAGIYCVATVADERRKGLGEHVTAEPLRRAAALGYRVGILQSSEAGLGVYRKLGFDEFGGLPLFVRVPA